MSILIVSLMLTHVMLATVHIHYLQNLSMKPVGNNGVIGKMKPMHFVLIQQLLSIVNLSTKSETVYVRQGEAIGG